MIDKRPKINKILIIGINNDFAIKLLNSLDYKNLEVYGLDLYYNTKFRRRYKKIYYPKNGNLSDTIDFIIKNKYDTIYLFDYFTQDVFFLNEENSKILYILLRKLIMNIIKPKLFIFISDTKPIKLLLHKKYKNLNFEEKKLKWSFQLENLIQRQNPQNWKILRFHNLFSEQYYHQVLHQMLFNANKIRKEKTKASSFFITEDIKTSFIEVNDALNYLKKIENIKSVGVYLISNPDVINIRDLYQYIMILFGINPKYIIKDKLNYELFHLNSSINLKEIDYNINEDFYSQIYKLYSSIVSKRAKYSYLIDYVYENINLK